MDTRGDILRWNYIQKARWFAGKNRHGQLTKVSPLDWYVRPDGTTPGVRSEICTISYPDGGVEFYQLLVSYRQTPLSDDHLGESIDGFAGLATDDSEALRAYLSALIRPQRPTETDWWSTITDSKRLHGDLTPHRLDSEQSNTNIVFGSTVLIKLIRRIEAGASLDIVLLDALSRTGVKQVAELVGWVSTKFDFGSGKAEHADLSMLTQFLVGAQDGWEYVKKAARSNEYVLDDMRSLGRALGQVHHGLAEVFQANRVSGDELADLMTARLEKVATQVEDLRPLKEPLTQIFAALRGRKLRVQRVHGDMHLGQTLKTPSGWYIIDFEGEPLKSLTERALPDSVWRDVAGLVRSLSYAAGQENSDSHWLSDQVRALLAGYSGSSLEEAKTYLLPEDDQLVLDAYIADRAIYESFYEMRNRPDWVDIPLSALRQITTTHNN